MLKKKHYSRVSLHLVPEGFPIMTERPLITLGFSSHRMEVLPYEQEEMWRHHAIVLARFIHEGAEGRLSRFCFGAKNATRGVGEGGRSLGGSFFDKNAGRDTPRVDFGRSYPPGLSRTDGGSGVNRGWPAGFATARPRGRGKDNPRPGAPRCGGWSLGCGPRSSRA